MNSPGPGSAAGGGAGPLTTCVETCGGASFGGADEAGRGPRLLKSCVNSLGPAEAPGACTAGGGTAGGDTGFAG